MSVFAMAYVIGTRPSYILVIGAVTNRVYIDTNVETLFSASFQTLSF
jgi:hypothetical protein